MRFRRNFAPSPQTRCMLNLLAIQGLFWFGWSFASYQTVYLQNNGMTTADIGVLNAVSSIVGIFASALWGLIADRINSIKKTFIVDLILSALFIAVIPFLPAKARYASTMFIIYCAAANFAKAPIGTLLDNLTIRNCAAYSLNYGPIRAFGSFTYTIGSALCTMLLATLSVQWTFWLTSILLIPPILCLFFAYDPKVVKPAKAKGGKGDMKALFGNYYYITFLIFIAALYIPLSTEGAFITYLMEEKGIPNTNYGLFLAVRALMEVPLLLCIRQLRQRIKLKYIVMAACVLMGVECLLQGLFANSFQQILLFACFFGFGNGLFIGSASMYVYKLAPDSLKASAQSFYAAVTSAASILGHLLGGFVYAALGGATFYITIGIAHIAAVGFFILTHIIGKNKGLTNTADELS